MADPIKTDPIRGAFIVLDGAHVETLRIAADLLSHGAGVAIDFSGVRPRGEALAHQRILEEMAQLDRHVDALAVAYDIDPRQDERHHDHLGRRIHHKHLLGQAPKSARRRRGR